MMHVAQMLLIHSLGGPRAVGPLLDPPVETCVVYRWASGHKHIPSDRLNQLRNLQRTCGKTWAPSYTATQKDLP